MHQVVESKDPPDLELLRAALAGCDVSAAQLERRHAKYLLRIVRRHAPSLSPELRGDVVQEAWLALFRKASIPQKLQAIPFRVFMVGLIRDGIKVVRTNNRPPGVPSRPGRIEAKASNGGNIDRIGERGVKDPVDPASPDLDLVLDIERLADRADRQVRDAIRLMAELQLSVAEAAMVVGISRQTLSRRLSLLTRAA